LRLFHYVTARKNGQLITRRDARTAGAPRPACEPPAALTPADSLNVRLLPVPAPADLAREWAALEEGADGSFFTSWAWKWRIDGVLGDAPAACMEGEATTLMVARTRPCHTVDLRGLGTSVDAYLAGLGAKTRYNVRRSLREYEELGGVRIDEAGTTGEAVSYLRGLKAMHQAGGRSRAGHVSSSLVGRVVRGAMWRLGVAGRALIGRAAGEHRSCPESPRCCALSG
jgi:hypothetical protein